MRLNGVPDCSEYFRKSAAVPFVAVADSNYIKDNFDLSTAVDNQTILASSLDVKFLPETGRNVTITLTDAAGTTLRVTAAVHGYNFFGKKITETFGPMSAAGGTYLGSKIFKEITSIVLTDVTAVAASDLMDVGFGDRLGMHHKVQSVDRVIIERKVVDTAAAGPSAPVMIEGSATYVDLDNKAFKAIGSNSGAFTDDDCFIFYYELSYDDKDDRFEGGG